MELVRSGTAAPGGGTFAGFHSPSTNDSGTTTFTADLTGGGIAGVFRGTGTADLVAIARNGQPSGNGSFSTFANAFIGASGRVLFTGAENFPGGTSARSGAWFVEPASTTPVSLGTGGAAPVGGGTITGITAADMNSSGGQIAFAANVSGGAAATQLYLTDGTEKLLVARTNDALLGSTIKSLSVGSLPDGGGTAPINNNGQVAYAVNLADGRSAATVYTPDLHWRGAASGQWVLPTNWTLGVAPHQVHDVFIDNGASVTGPSSGFTTVHSLTLSNGVTASTVSFAASTTILNQLATRFGGWLTVTASGMNGSVTAGSVNNQGEIVVSNGGSFSVRGGIDGGSGTISVGTLGTSGFLDTNYLRQSTVYVTAGGRLTIRPKASGGATSVVQFVSVNSGAVNLNDNALVIDYSFGSPITDYNGYLKRGYGAGSWNGDGITSGVAASTPGTGLGIAEATDLFTMFPATFAGQTVDNSSLLIRYTRSGDANLDGKVDTLDFNALAASFGKTGQRWSKGDFTYDGVVDTLDFNSLAANFGKSAPSSDAAAAGSVVPEPAWAAVMLLSFAALLGRKR
jgi:hypothetical protein